MLIRFPIIKVKAKPLTKLVPKPNKIKPTRIVVKFPSRIPGQALFKLIPVTLTLAGIGGVILSLGMVVDANVLIFSRLREELKTGKSFPQGLEDGFNRAWPAIRDGNLTTLLVAVILFGFGTSFIKGFATTLSIGILISMFSAIIITKTFLKCFVGTRLERVKWLW